VLPHCEVRVAGVQRTARPGLRGSCGREYGQCREWGMTYRGNARRDLPGVVMNQKRNVENPPSDSETS